MLRTQFYRNMRNGENKTIIFYYKKGVMNDITVNVTQYFSS